MQKNKFVRENIKAVCSSAAKKLVAMGLVVSLGIAGSTLSNMEASAMGSSSQQGTQVPEAQDPTNQAVGGNQEQPAQQNAGAPPVQQPQNVGVHTAQQRPYVDVNDNSVVDVTGRGPVWVRSGNSPDNCPVRVDGDRIVWCYGTKSVTVYPRAYVTKQQPKQQPLVSVASATQNEALSVTVAPGVRMRTQNGTTFIMGANVPETLENLQRAIATSASSNLFVRFVSGLMSVFTYIFFGRWLGGSGGSK